MTKFESDFIKYTELILSNENFAYARYADGEVLLMQGRSVGLNTQAYYVDRWSSADGLTIAGQQLLESALHLEDNYHYAISAHSDSIADYNFLTTHIRNKNITFANLWINSNYSKMKAFYERLDKSVYLICNHKAVKTAFPFPVEEIFPFPDDCIKYWEQEGESYLNQLLDYTTQVNNKTFFISAGPISEILIHKMYLANPNNQYVDVGSSIDEYVHGVKTRPYMNEGTYYATQISFFNE